MVSVAAAAYIRTYIEREEVTGRLNLLLVAGLRNEHFARGRFDNSQWLQWLLLPTRSSLAIVIMSSYAGTGSKKKRTENISEQPAKPECNYLRSSRSLA